MSERQCTQCKWLEPGPQGLTHLAQCIRPDPLTGIPGPGGISFIKNQRGYSMDELPYEICGREGRFFEPMTIEPKPPKKWYEFWRN